MSQSEVSALPSKWNVPYRRNVFFTGREDILARLYDTLAANKTAALTQPQAISGLGGIGKTQTALEYVYRYGNEYNAVLWAKADSREVLVSDFVSIADLFHLPEKSEQDQNRVVNAVKRWLQTNKNWLLILDNVEDLTMVSDFIPPASNGHILLTTRAQATGTIANNIEIEKMEPEEGALVLLHRAKLIETASEEDLIKAKEISQEMDGLPLALDQAGAFIEETGCSLLEYLELYQAERAFLLKDRGESDSDHPESVTVTFLLSFEKIARANPVAADLLRLSAFLYADDIPEEIITEGAPDLGPILQPVAANPLQLKKAIAELRKYSLVRRDSDAKMLSIHRLVQAVIKDGMDEETQRLWVERTVRAVNRAFPNADFATWPQCQRCLPHAQVCASLIKQWNLSSMEASLLLDRAGRYLKEQALHIQAEPLYLLSLTILKHCLGLSHPDVATCLNNIADLYRSQGKYVEAKLLYQQAITIWEQALGQEHSYVAIGYNNLALLYYTEGNYVQAEPLFQKVLAIREKTPEEQLNIANSLSTLAGLYYAQGKYSQADPLAQKALVIREQILDPNHPHLSNSLNGLALIYRAQGKYSQAESLHLRALAIRKQVRGDKHPSVATCLNDLALLYSAQGKYDQAETFYLQAKAIYEQSEVSNHPDLATNLINLAVLYSKQGKYEQARPLHQRALAIREHIFGVEHPKVAQCLQDYAALLRKTKQDSEATKLEERAKAIQAKHPQESPPQ